MKNIFNSSTWVNKIEDLEINRPKYFSALIACVFLFASFVVTVPRGASAATRPSVSLEQCANKNSTCDSNVNANQWQTGNLNTNNSTYAEGESVPYRAEFIHLTAGQSYQVTIEWDTTKAGIHATDYLASYDMTELTAFPCAGISCGPNSHDLPIGIDPHVTNEGVGQLAGQVLRAFGATFPTNGAAIPNTGNLCASASCSVPNNHGAYNLTGTYAGSSSTSIDIVFTANESTVVLSWGGHLAKKTDWGDGNSASAISGSEFHMRVLDFRCSNVDNCSAGSLDRSLKLDACDAACATTTTSTAAPTTTTSTSTSTSTTTTLESTTTTSTTLPVDVTTTTLVIFSETTVPQSSTTTSPAVTTTTAPAVTTTSVAGGSVSVSNTTPASPQGEGDNFQNNIPTITNTPSDTFDVLIPDGLPITGAQLSILLFAILMLLVTGGLFMKVSQVQVRRNMKDEDQ
ncbi:unannotated protein [freshwater metagenome]|uniref:Unannotated protein n=1 Tax=freshwater metagenome TaxID=449393 RepID=A0A6J6G497_9ZZZZ